MNIILLISNIVIILVLWWLTFTSYYWNKKLYFQLILFIAPTFFGLVVTCVFVYFLPLQVIKENKILLYIYSSLYLILLIPQWYKLAWTRLALLKKNHIKEGYSLIFTIIFAVTMIIAMVLLFAMLYLWIYLIAGNSQGLLSAQHHYQSIPINFATAVYFSFVTYFTLGYGDLVPFGFWVRSFVFFQCIVSVINTGIIVIYAYNFLLPKNQSAHILRKTN